MQQQIIYLKLILTMAIWGGTFVVGRTIAQTINPFTAGFGRFAIAFFGGGLVILGVSLVNRKNA